MALAALVLLGLVVVIDRSDAFRWQVIPPLVFGYLVLPAIQRARERWRSFGDWMACCKPEGMCRLHEQWCCLLLLADALVVYLEDR